MLDQSTVPLQLLDVDEVMEDLVTDMDATPGPSPVQLEAEQHVDEVAGSATRDSTPQPELSQESYGGAAELVGLENTLYDIIKEFFHSFTER